MTDIRKTVPESGDEIDDDANPGRDWTSHRTTSAFDPASTEKPSVAFEQGDPE